MEITKEQIAELVKNEIQGALSPLIQERSAFMKEFFINVGRSDSGEEKKPERGIVFSQVLRALASGKGDLDRAVGMAKKVYGESAHVVKALQASSATAGGVLIAETVAADFIELLRAMAVVRSMNPSIIPMPTGQAKIRKLTGGATASYVGEGSAPNATQETTGYINLAYKILTAIVPISNDLLLFSGTPGSERADTMVRDDAVSAVATTEDSNFIRGDGTEHAPQGLRYKAAAANIAASAGTTYANVETDIAAMLQALMGSNVRMLRPGWLMAPRSYNYLWKLRDAVGNLIFRDELDKGRLAGFPYKYTNNIPTNLGASANESELYLADFADVVIGETAGIEVEMSTDAAYKNSDGTLVSAFAQNETVLRIIARHDIGLRHAESVAIRTGVQWGV